VSLRHFKWLLKQVKNSTDFHAVSNQRPQTDVTLLRGNSSIPDASSNLKIADLTFESQGYPSETLSSPLTFLYPHNKDIFNQINNFISIKSDLID
jgi:hypothetical protein